MRGTAWRELDLQVLESFLPSGRPVLILATKMDKLTPSAQRARRDGDRAGGGLGAPGACGAGDGDPVLGDPADRDRAGGNPDRRMAGRDGGIDRGAGRAGPRCRGAGKQRKGPAIKGSVAGPETPCVGSCPLARHPLREESGRRRRLQSQTGTADGSSEEKSTRSPWPNQGESHVARAHARTVGARRPQAGAEAARPLRRDDRARSRPRRPGVAAALFRPGRGRPCAGGGAPRQLLRRPPGHGARRAPRRDRRRGRAVGTVRGRDVPAGRAARAARGDQRLSRDAGHLLPGGAGGGVRRAHRLVAGLPGFLHPKARAPARPLACAPAGRVRRQRHRAARARHAARERRPPGADRLRSRRAARRDAQRDGRAADRIDADRRRRRSGRWASSPART